MKKTKADLKFPWLGYLICFLCVAFLLVVGNPQYAALVRLPPILMAEEFRMVAVLLVPFALMYELFRFRDNRRSFDKQIEKYEQQISRLLNYKSALQSRAHKFAGHADKLKMFISDRLLEYIEYDEKFLHFKNIASEVRHNGVISYDKVQSAIRRAMAAEKDKDRCRQYEEALASMVYLWDLLDLSTTDNIAMYVANKVYESEEQYYRSILKKDDGETIYVPIFSVRRAIVKALKGFIEGLDTGALDNLKGNAPFFHEDDMYRVELANSGSLLGTENYVVLMMENLINNALFYANSRRYGSRYSRIAINLRREREHAAITVYGCGPLIGDEAKDQIFKLGFSTKRSKGHNGKGLGLYFVKQIVTGYEGQIEFDNITNEADTYVIRAELHSGEKINEIIDVSLDDSGKPVCRTGGDDTVLPEAVFKFENRIRSVEVSVQSLKKTFDLNEFEKNGKAVLVDPNAPDIPRWVLEVTHHRHRAKMLFKPLDVAGVRFRITLPTAESRLDPDYYDAHSDDLADFEQVDIELDDIDGHA